MVDLKWYNIGMKLKGNVKLTSENKETGEITTQIVHNVSCDVGMESLASRLVGANKGQVTYLAVGTGTATPASTDTTLATELERKQISVRTSSGDTATFRTFFNTTEANGTLKEIGLFGDDATGTVDSGTLFAHASVDKTKTSSETLTIDWSLTIS